MADLFGAISGAITLAISIKDFCDSLTCDSGNDRLILQIQHDTAVLQSFTEIFGTVAQRTDLEMAEKQRLEEICQSLKPLLEKLREWIEKRQRMHEGNVSWSLKIVDKFASILWKNADIRVLAAELTTWTERYHIRLSLLPMALSEKLLKDRTLGEEKYKTHVAVRDLRSAFNDLNLGEMQAATLLRERLLQADSMHSRVFGAFDGKRVVVEYKKYPDTLSRANLDRLSSAVGRLAVVLQHADASLCRILKCEGYVHQPQEHQFALIYNLPYAANLGSKPRTLLDLIKSTRPSAVDPSKPELVPPLHPLNERFELARKIACAVLYVHAMAWVHKSVRTNNVIILEKNDPAQSSSDNTRRFPKTLGNPYLCGFDTARQDKASSDQQGDVFWDLNVYRHPARQGRQPEERYTMNHDIYSLGVVLLELGIWKPLLALSGLKNLRLEHNSLQVKAFFLKLAAESLPVLMGWKYYSVVRFCLEIDGENAVTANTAIDEVLSKLEEMSIGLH